MKKELDELEELTATSQHTLPQKEKKSRKRREKKSHNRGVPLLPRNDIFNRGTITSNWTSLPIFQRYCSKLSLNVLTKNTRNRGINRPKILLKVL